MLTKCTSALKGPVSEHVWRGDDDRAFDLTRIGRAILRDLDAFLDVWAGLDIKIGKEATCVRRVRMNLGRRGPTG
jgi:hypothetical protein